MKCKMCESNNEYEDMTVCGLCGTAVCGKCAEKEGYCCPNCGNPLSFYH